MKINISIMTWVNRFFMIPFILCLLVGLITNKFWFYALYMAFIVGAFQVFSFMMTLFYLKKIENSTQKLILIYVGILIFFFLQWYLNESVVKLYKNDFF